MTYQYRAYTLDKRIVQGTIDAPSERMAEEALYQAGYHRVLRLREIQPRLNLKRLLPNMSRVRSRDVIDFSRQLATLLESGIPILTALQLLEKQAPAAALREIIAGLAEELRGGSSFSQALGKYPQVFPVTYCQMIRAREKTGHLEVALRQVADYIEKRAATTQGVKRALAYPSVVLALAIGVFALLIAVALPPLAQLFTALGAELPLMTRLLIATADFFVNYKLHLLVGLFSVTLLILGYMRLPAGKLAIDSLMLKIPVIGSINIQRNISHFCQTTSMLLEAGFLLPRIIDIVIPTIGNRIIGQALREVEDKLVQGQGLSQTMATVALFPQLLTEMVIVGEKTGTLGSNLASMADFYGKRVDQRVQTLVSMIQPSLIVVVGLLIGFIALSMITPLYSILGKMY